MAINKKQDSSPAKSAWRRALVLSLLIIAFAGAIYATQQIEQFLIRDPRFALSPPLEYGEESPALHLEGIKFAARNDIRRVFQQDAGRSLYLLPMVERRKALLRIPWVKDASIMRTWPNQITVHVRERQPVAFVQVRSESISRWSLIDQEGVVLEPPQGTPFDLPVATGMRFQETQSMRATRLRRMMRMLDELGPLRQKISEVDVADLDNLKATVKIDQRAVVLMLGDHNFRSRFQNFLDHYDEIRKRIWSVGALDLELDGRIFTVPAEQVETASPSPEFRHVE